MPMKIKIIDKTEWFNNELREIDKKWSMKIYKRWLAITEWYYGMNINKIIIKLANKGLNIIKSIPLKLIKKIIRG